MRQTWTEPSEEAEKNKDFRRLIEAVRESCGAVANKVKRGSQYGTDMVYHMMQQL